MKFNEIKESLIRIHNDNSLGLDANKFGTDKLLYKSYIEYLYPHILSELNVDKVNNVVEIGVRGGVSLFMWGEFFKKATITGVDICDIDSEHGPRKEYLKLKNVVFIKGNAYGPEVSSKIDGNIDLIVDDGSHYLEDQVKFVELYLDKISRNGVLVIEDVQNGYADVGKILSIIPDYGYELRVHDFRYKRSVYDDFSISIVKGVMPYKYKLLYKVRAKFNLLEKIIIRLMGVVF